MIDSSWMTRSVEAFGAFIGNTRALTFTCEDKGYISSTHEKLGVCIERSQMAQIKDIARRNGITLYSLFLIESVYF